MKRIFLALLVCSVMICGCSSKTSNIDEKKAGNYITFNVTKEENTSLTMYNYYYDIDSKKLELMAEIPYESEYPLSVYDKKDNVVYYSKREKGKSDDNLYCLDLGTKKSTRLSYNFYAINNIIPLKDELYIAAVEKKQRPIGLYRYHDGKYERLLDNDDLFVSRINHNPDIDTLYFNTYSESEMDKLFEENTTNNPIVKNQLFKLNYTNNEIKKIDETNPGDIEYLGINSNHEAFYKMLSSEVIYLNHGELEQKNVFDDLSISCIVYMNQDYLYFIDRSRNKLIEYDIKNKESSTIYETDIDTAAINNAIVLQ